MGMGTWGTESQIGFLSRTPSWILHDGHSVLLPGTGIIFLPVETDNIKLHAKKKTWRDERIAVRMSVHKLHVPTTYLT